MTQELYINGESLDLATDTQVTLNFKSNILGAIDKIVASNSQTIRVPKTTRNRRILDNPTAPAYSSRYRYKRLPCRYLQNGIELVNGYAVLLDSAEEYELAMYWGVMTQFQEWLDAAPSLRDIKENVVEKWEDFNEAYGYSQVTDDGYGYAAYDNGVTTQGIAGLLQDTEKTNIFPSVTVQWLMERIQEDAGVSFVFPDRFEEVFRNLAVPCVSREAAIDAWEGSRYYGDVYLSTEGGGLLYTAWSAISQTGLVVDKKGLFVGNQSQDVYDYIIGSNGLPQYALVGNYVWSMYQTMNSDWIRVIFQNSTDGMYNSESRLRVNLCDEGNKVLKHIDFAPKKNASGKYYFDLDEKIDTKDYPRFYLEIAAQKSNLNLSNALQIVVPFDEMEYGIDTDYSIVPNLPDIEQIKFVNAICEMFGLYAMGDANDPKVIRFVSLDDLVSLKTEAVDWSDKLMLSAGSEPKEVQFSMGDYAQRNIFRYNEDDEVKETGEGVITLPNESLNPEEDLVSLPFSASDGNKIVQWELDDDGEKVTFQNSGARIMRIYEDENGYACLTFRGLSFESLLPKYYSTLIDLLNDVVVIKEKMKLNEVDLKTLDYERPVYLRQYGRYYGIREIQADGDECEVELVQLKPYMSDCLLNAYINHEAVGINTTTKEPIYGFVLNIDANRPIASEIQVEVAYTSGTETKTKVVEMSAGDSGYSEQLDDESAYNAEITKITPKADSVYRYKAADLDTIRVSGKIVAGGSWGIYFVASKPVASPITVTYKILDVEGIGSNTTATIEDGQTEVLAATFPSRNFGGIEFVGITPARDSEYNYILVEQVTYE